MYYLPYNFTQNGEQKELDALLGRDLPPAPPDDTLSEAEGDDDYHEQSLPYQPKAKRPRLEALAPSPHPFLDRAGGHTTTMSSIDPPPGYSTSPGVWLLENDKVFVVLVRECIGIKIDFVVMVRICSFYCYLPLISQERDISIEYTYSLPTVDEVREATKRRDLNVPFVKPRIIRENISLPWPIIRREADRLTSGDSNWTGVIAPKEDHATEMRL